MRVYWITWGGLLVLTVSMLWADGAPIPRTVLVAFMLAAMLAKAATIGGNFMHLRRESPWIAVTVVLGLLLNAVILYVLIAPDAARIHMMARPQAVSRPQK
jgi:hypothetical protein